MEQTLRRTQVDYSDDFAFYYKWTFARMFRKWEETCYLEFYVAIQASLNLLLTTEFILLHTRSISIEHSNYSYLALHLFHGISALEVRIYTIYVALNSFFNFLQDEFLL